MKIDIDQMSIRELIEHFKMLGFFETERPEMERELDSEIKQLESDIKTLTDRRNKLTSQLESIKTGKVFDTTEAGNSIRRQGQTIRSLPNSRRTLNVDQRKTGLGADIDRIKSRNCAAR